MSARWWQWVLGIGLGLGESVGLGGCGGLEPVATYEPTTDPAQLYFGLVLNHRAITLSTVAPYDTLQLTATPLDATGASLADLPAPVFTSSDTTVVWVTSEGRLQARGVGTGVQVIASLTAPGNIRHADTALVTVTTGTPPTLASLTLVPYLASEPMVDSTALQFCPDGIYQIMDVAFRLDPYDLCEVDLTTTARDAEGGGIPGLVVEYQSLDPAIAVPDVAVDPGASLLPLHTRRPGQARIVARATAYGITRADTITLTVNWPATQIVTIGQSETPFLLPAEIWLAPYGLVAWRNYLSDSVDVIFDDPTNITLPPDAVCGEWLDVVASFFGPGPHCGAGNILLRGIAPRDSANRFFGGSYWTVQVRQFPVPGVYTYHSTRASFTGRIIVTNDPDPGAAR